MLGANPLERHLRWLTGRGTPSSRPAQRTPDHRVDPAELGDPADPAELVDPADPAERVDPADRVDRADPSKARAVRVVTSPEQVRSDASSWVLPSTLPTQQPSWIQTCTELQSSRGELCVLVLGDRVRPRAVAPLAWGTGRAPALELLGVARLHEPMDLLAEDPPALEALVEELARLGAPLFFRRVPTESPTVAAIARIFRRRGWVSLRPAISSPFVRLERSASDLGLSSSLRRDLRRGEGRARAFGPLGVRVLEPTPEELPAVLELALSIEAASWKGRAGSALNRSPELGAFYRAYAARAAQQGVLRIAFLDLGDQTAAMQLAVEVQGAYWLLKIGYDERFARCSPGLLLMHATLRWAAARGLERYEFLGGAESWTQRWTRAEHPTLAIRVFPTTFPGLAAFARSAATVALDRAQSAWTRAVSSTRWSEPRAALGDGSSIEPAAPTSPARP